MTQRTGQQRKSIEVYCHMMADDLNNTEASVQKVCKLPIDFTQENFKELIWKPVQHAMFPDITSTTQLDTIQVNAVYEQVNKIMGQEWGVSNHWPSYENELNDSLIKQSKGEK